MVLNRASGGFDRHSEAQARSLFEGAGVADASIVCADPANLRITLKRALDGADVVVILAGDGTMAAAASLCGGQGPAVVPLPGGTMNVLSHALYGRNPWQDTLRRVLAAPRARIVSGGRAGDRVFMVSAMLGVPSRWIEAREALRKGHLRTAARRLADAWRQPYPEVLRYRFGPGVEGAARAIAVRCPLTSRALSPQDALLEAAAIDPRSAARALELGVNALFGRWRDDPDVKTATTTVVRVARPGGVPAVLDGEAIALPQEVELAFTPRALTVLAPSGRA
jgi:diacylglycerol kinase family enzyme